MLQSMGSQKSDKKGHPFVMLVPEYLVGLHRPVQFQLI